MAIKNRSYCYQQYNRIIEFRLNNFFCGVGMDKSRYIYTPYEQTVTDHHATYKDHPVCYDLKTAQAYCKAHGLTCMSISFQGYDRHVEGDWVTYNTETICFLDDGTWEQADYYNLRAGTNY